MLGALWIAQRAHHEQIVSVALIALDRPQPIQRRSLDERRPSPYATEPENEAGHDEHRAAQYSAGKLAPLAVGSFSS